MKCRPVGIHKHFRMINLFMSLNPELASPPHISMLSIHEKLKSLYDMDYLQEQTVRLPSSSDDEADDGNSAALGASSSNFSLPYNEYHELIEAQGAAGAESASGTPPPNSRDLHSSPTQSIKTESMQEEEDEAEEGEEEEPVAEKVPAKRGRKRNAAGAIKAESEAKSTPRASKRNSIQGSVGGGTPGATDDESMNGSSTRASKKTRAAPSRKSTRKK
ncbi:protein of unknown function [Taphrina deformans PYCC 5710]|uniref:Chromatin modification-related protein EAF7 n=1 Tax=Taphrina deformans (strain PYCC 5710 / ATCC 11124 / CBS 356.35 / IMI 108563 / JCM 9778 / NBRC 8474) TaxID=1097556 RepID=R4XC54_TAPDE|nr:protein of unknown function [Taphrina deformans PYCC 5710]|eukprot:CCG81961.1 protein of unknown function [Taphrina deformans PYCC 5710]